VKKIVVGIISRIRKDRKEFLLMSSVVDFGKYTGFFYPPGGHIVDGKTEKSTLAKKFWEELGIKVKPLKRLATTPGDVKDQVTYWWECQSNLKGLTINKEKARKIIWMSKKEILEGEKIWPATKKFFKKFVIE